MAKRKIKLKKPNSSPVEEKIQTGSISEDEIQVIKWTPNFVIETQNSLNNYTENLLINYILKSKSNFNRQKFEEIRKNKKKPNKSSIETSLLIKSFLIQRIPGMSCKATKGYKLLTS